MFTTKEEVEGFLIKNKGNLLINKAINKFFNLNEDTLEDKYPILPEHIASVGDYLSKNVSYFSFNQIIKYCFFRTDMPGRAKDIDKNIKIPFAIPFGNTLFKILPEKCDSKYYNIVLEIDYMGGYFTENNPELVKAILKAKIASSSFFFWEILEVLDIKLPIRISPNKFFPNLSHFKQFMNEFSVTLSEFKEESFSNIFLESFKESRIQEDFFIKDERVIVPISNNIEINSFFYVEEKSEIDVHQPFKRSVFIPENSFGNSYKFYMNEMLDLRPPGFPITKKILEFLNNKIKSTLLADQCWEYIEKLSLQVKGKEIYINNIRVFFLIQQSQIDNIKYQARKIGINHFYICDLSKLSCDLIKVRKIHKKDIILEY